MQDKDGPLTKERDVEWDEPRAEPYDTEENRSITEHNLSHAAGALDDIYITITSCVAPASRATVHRVCEAVLERILSSDHQSHSPPSWCIHEWERDLWAKYLRGELDACAQGTYRRHPIPDVPIPPLPRDGIEGGE